MRKAFEIGGMVAAAVLVAFGVAAIVIGVSGRSTVRDNLAEQKIVGSPDMTPAAPGMAAKGPGHQQAGDPQLLGRRQDGSTTARPRAASRST